MILSKNLQKIVFILINAELSQLKQYVELHGIIKNFKDTKSTKLLLSLISDEQRHARGFIKILGESELPKEDITRGIKRYYKDFRKSEKIDKEFRRFAVVAKKEKSLYLSKYIRSLVIEESRHDKILKSLLKKYDR